MSRTDAAEAAAQSFEDGVSLALARLHRRHLIKRDASPDEVVELERKIAVLRQRMLQLQRVRLELPIHQLTRFASLSDFDIDVLWMVLAGRVEPMVSELAAAIADDKQRFWVSPALCLDVLLETRRERYQALESFSDDAPLIRSGVVSFVSRTPGAPRGIHDMLIPAGFLPAWMQGRRTVSEAAAPFVTRVPPSLTLDLVALPTKQRKELRAALDMVPWDDTLFDPRLGAAGFDFQRGALLIVTGPRGMGKTLVARALAGEARRAALVCDAEELGSRASDEAEAALEALFVEAGLTGDWLVLDGATRLLSSRTGDGTGSDRPAWARVRSLLQRFPVVCIVTADNIGQIASPLRDRAFFQYELPPIGRDQALMAWTMNRPDRFVAGDDIDFREIAQRHALTGRGIQAAINLVLRAKQGVVSGEMLEAACLAQQTSGMGDVARRAWVNRERSDLQLPPRLESQIDEIIETERVRDRVLDEWGLAARMGKGLGLVCLFDGEPGTGKTLAAEVIASELGVPLFAVNVANVVSKWIGETEKNLQRIFDEASRNRCVLLFDEADALFSRRMSVERSIDRHANMEVGLLLQLVENHRGLVLLTTNLKDSIDPAFARRFAYKLTFEFPDPEVRERVWRVLLPNEQLAANVNPAELGDEFELSGGGIRNVVLRAAYRAAVKGKRIDQHILRECALAECRALGKLVREGR